MRPTLVANCTVALLISLFAGEALGRQHEQSAEDGIAERSVLTGNWAGYRTELEQAGIQLNSTLVGEVLANVSGGLERDAAVVENWQFGASADLEELFEWEGAHARLAILQNNGQQPSRFVGDIQTASNIEAVQTIRFYELWLEQNLVRNHISLLTGVYDINSEFDVIRSGLLFLNSSQGIGGELAASGLKGPPTFPATAATARLKIMPDTRFYLQAALTDGVPGVRHVDWDLAGEEGRLWIGEAGYYVGVDEAEGRQGRKHISRESTAGYNLKIALGGWSYSQNYANVRYDRTVPEYRKEWGGYLLMDMPSLSWIHRSLDALSWHLRTGLTDNELSRFHTYFGTGFTVRGLLADDPGGEMGLAVSMVENSRVYERQAAAGAEPEVALEWTYRTPVLPWLSLQPDLQYIINPGARGDVANALVLGLRTSVEL